MGIPNFSNRTLFQGDNLPFLRGINSETVDLIATDPPFNKSKDFHATPDSLASGASFQDRWSWADDIQLEWLAKIAADEPEVSAVINTAKAVYGDDMGAFLCWLGVRLLECHRILKPTGSLYLHIDHTAHAWAKCLLDAIFGRENFQNEVVWCYSSGGASPSRYAKKHDTLLFYSKGASFTFNTPREPHTSVINEANSHLFNPAGKVMTDWWTDIQYLHHASKERTGYPTQKPLALYERIIRASSNEGDVVLDPHCGCATTPVAAERLGRQWLGMDIWEVAHGIILDRLNKEKQIWRPEDVQLLTTPLERTDGGDTATEYLATPTRERQRSPYPRPRTQHPKLLADLGPFCQGCGRDYSFQPRALEVDHKWPKSQGGDDRYENLTLLCGPCNLDKKDKLTLAQLQDLNRQRGELTAERERNIRRDNSARPARQQRRGRRR